MSAVHLTAEKAAETNPGLARRIREAEAVQARRYARLDLDS